MPSTRAPELEVINGEERIKFGDVLIVQTPDTCPECGKEYPKGTCTFFFYGPGERMPKEAYIRNGTAHGRGYYCWDCAEKLWGLTDTSEYEARFIKAAPKKEKAASVPAETPPTGQLPLGSGPVSLGFEEDVIFKALTDGVPESSKHRTEHFARLVLGCMERISRLEYYVDKLRRRSTKHLQGS